MFAADSGVVVFWASDVCTRAGFPTEWVLQGLYSAGTVGADVQFLSSRRVRTSRQTGRAAAAR